MQTQEQTHHHHSHHGCCEGPRTQSRGPEMFYGYCHESGRMRMMDLSDYVDNTQTAYSNLASRMSSMYQPYMQTLQQAGAGPGQQQGQGRHHGHHHESCCHDEHDCHCSCCIRCADAVEYARCDEVRSIPVTFENDSRRERDVKLELGPFVTDSGKEMWHGTLSEQEFKLAPCGEKTIIIRVPVNCGTIKQDPNTPPGQDPASGTPTAPKGGTSDGPPAATVPPSRQTGGTVDSCTVGYATLRAEGCMIRPLVIALAVLPNDCGAHRAGCQCGCCC